MSIIFTSFSRSHRYSGRKFSICECQPEEYNYEELYFFAPMENVEGKSLRSSAYFREYKGEMSPDAFYYALGVYRQDILAAYSGRIREILHWLRSLSPHEDLVLCCRCPHTKTSRMLKKHVGLFACHSGIVSEIIALARPDLTIIQDVDRSKDLVPQWRFGLLEGFARQN